MKFKILPLSILFFVAMQVNAMDAQLERGKVYLESADGRHIEISQRVVTEHFPGLTWIAKDSDVDFPPLIIKKVDDTIGYGLFAGADIRAGERVFYYGSIPTSDPYGNPYCLRMAAVAYGFDGKNYGNAGRFAFHLPPNLSNYHLDQQIDPDDVAIANTKLAEDRLYEGFPLFFAVRDIKKYQAIGFPYGEVLCINLAKDYHEQMELIFKKGVMVPRDKRSAKERTILVVDPCEVKESIRWDGTAEELRAVMAGYETIQFGKPTEMRVLSSTIESKLQSHDTILILQDEGCQYCHCIKEEMRRCSKCKRARYCSSDCYQKHWSSSHRFKCKDFKK